jgi:DNA repair exonuclease SbcCD ATPase subunit
MLLLAVLLLSGVDAVRLLDSKAQQNVDSRHLKDVDQVMKTWSSIVTDVWADLVIAAEEPVDLAKSDEAVKDTFVKDCAVSLDVHPTSKDAVGKTMSALCGKAGGTEAECKDMTKTLWEAHEAKKLKPWCEKTFAWFAGKTKPKCLQKCKAFLCKDRCALKDEINDLSDEVSAYQIKLDTVSTKEKRAQEVAKSLEEDLASVEKVDKTECKPAGENVTKLEDSQKSITKELADLKKATSKVSDDKDKAFESLKKVKANKKAKKDDAKKAEADYKKASDTFLEAKEKQAKKNKIAIDLAGDVLQARLIKKARCEKMNNMKDEYEENKKSNDKELKELTAEKKKIEESMGKVEAKKKSLETPLNAALKAA